MHQWRLLCHLPALPNLYISDCSDLTSSRESIWALSSLQSLSVHRGYQAQLPKWLGHLTALQKLSISWCKNLNNLQEIMACRTSLKELCISNCKVIVFAREHTATNQAWNIRNFWVPCTRAVVWIRGEQDEAGPHQRNGTRPPLFGTHYNFLV